MACSVADEQSAQQMATSQPQRLDGSTWQGASASSTNSLRPVALPTEQPGAPPSATKSSQTRYKSEATTGFTVDGDGTPLVTHARHASRATRQRLDPRKP